MYFDSFTELIDIFNNIKDKFFCKKRERQEEDYNCHYLYKKQAQASYYFEKKKDNEYGNFLLTNNANKRTFQTVNLIKYRRQRQFSNENKSSCSSNSNLTFNEDKNDFNDQILKANINLANQAKRREEKELVIDPPKARKPKYNFKTKIITLEDNNDSISDKSNSSRNYLSCPSLIEEKINFEDFDHFTRYIIRKKDNKNYPIVDYNVFQLFQE